MAVLPVPSSLILLAAAAALFLLTGLAFVTGKIRGGCLAQAVCLVLGLLGCVFAVAGSVLVYHGL